jgi:hypothetical protein
MTASPIERLLRKVELDTDMGCRIWTGTTNNGSPRMRFEGAYLYPRRLVFEHSRGPIPAGFEVVMRCGRTLCVAEEHMTLKRKGGRFLGPEDDTTPALLGQSCADYDRVSLLCARGHLVVGDNARTLSTSGEVVRQCRTCRDAEPGSAGGCA